MYGKGYSFYRLMDFAENNILGRGMKLNVTNNEQISDLIKRDTKGFYKRAIESNFEVIGYNSKNQLLELLDSLNCVVSHACSVEVVYVDDGSADNSFEMFSDYNLKFNNVQIINTKLQTRN